MFCLLPLPYPSRPNPSDASSWPAISRNVRANPDGAAPVPAQLDLFSEGPELAILLPPIGARAAKTLLVCLCDKPTPPVAAPVAYRKTAPGFEISNGRLRLVKHEADGDLFDRIELDGVELGRYYPLIHQALPQDMWVAPDRLESIDAVNGPVRLALTATLSRGGAAGEIKTAVDDKGKYAEARQGPARFRTSCRVCVYPGRAWFTTQALSVENTDERAWTVAAYFHYAPSNLAGDAADDEGAGPRWYDEAARLAYGAADPAKAFRIAFWKDKGGGQHPDARREVGVELAPGAVHREPPFRLYLGGAKGEGTQAWQVFEDEVKTVGGISYRVCEAP